MSNQYYMRNHIFNIFKSLINHTIVCMSLLSKELIMCDSKMGTNIGINHLLTSSKYINVMNRGMSEKSVIMVFLVAQNN